MSPEEHALEALRAFGQSLHRLGQAAAGARVDVLKVCQAFRVPHRAILGGSSKPLLHNGRKPHQ